MHVLPRGVRPEALRPQAYALHGRAIGFVLGLEPVGCEHADANKDEGQDVEADGPPPRRGATVSRGHHHLCCGGSAGQARGESSRCPSSTRTTPYSLRESFPLKSRKTIGHGRSPHRPTILIPTTVLSQQHLKRLYTTFLDLLSRISPSHNHLHRSYYFTGSFHFRVSRHFSVSATTA